MMTFSVVAIKSRRCVPFIFSHSFHISGFPHLLQIQDSYLKYVVASSFHIIFCSEPEYCPIEDTEEKEERRGEE
jgi:hypothetical protein